VRILYQVLKTDNYLLVVDDSEIREGDWFYSKGNCIEKALINYPKSEHIGKIIAYLQLDNSFILDGVDLLPPLEDGVKKMSLDYHLNNGHYYYSETAFKDGYNKAKETYKYTDEDMRSAFEYGKTLEPFDSFDDFIKSLQQSKFPVAFIRTDIKYNIWVGKYIY